jgi:hypothetical protein
MNPYGPIIDSTEDGDEVEFTFTFERLGEKPRTATVRGLVHVYDSSEGPTDQFPDGIIKLVGTQAINIKFRPKALGAEFHMDAFRILAKAAS